MESSPCVLCAIRPGHPACLDGGVKPSPSLGFPDRFFGKGEALSGGRLGIPRIVSHESLQCHSLGRGSCGCSVQS